MTEKNSKISVLPKVKKFKLSDIAPMETNPRTIDDDAYRGLSASLMEYGCLEPIIVNVHGGQNVIVGGHQRYQVLIDNSVTEFLCVVVDLEPAKAQALNLVLNNLAIQGQFVEELDAYLDELLLSIPDETFIALHLDKLRKELTETPLLDGPDDLPEDPNPQVSDVTVLVGEYRCLISREDYDAWKEDVRQSVGFEPAAVVTEMKRRLQIQ